MSTIYTGPIDKSQLAEDWNRYMDPVPKQDPTTEALIRAALAVAAEAYDAPEREETADAAMDGLVEAAAAYRAAHPEAGKE